jgi:hypothetical protein
MAGTPARRCLARAHGGPSAAHLAAKCSSRTDRAILASSGERTPPTQWITGGQKGVVSHRDAVPDDHAFGPDQDFSDHAA